MKIVMLQYNTIIGDLKTNTDLLLCTIGNFLRSDQQVDLIVTPEAFITGYPPLDLVERDGFIDDQLEYVEIIKKATIGSKFTVALGCITKNEGPGKPLFNSVRFFKNGEEAFPQYNKILLPTYNWFDERRHFEPGKSNCVIEINGKKIAFFICEDCWGESSHNLLNKHLYDRNPVLETFDNYEVDYVVSLNASPSTIWKREIRENVIREIVDMYGVPFVYVNQVGGQDGIIFDGNSFVMDKTGDIFNRLPGFEDSMCVVDMDKRNAHFRKLPEIPSEIYYQQIVLGIKDYVNKTGMKGIVVGCSGGIDSAIVLALAVDALGSNRVKAITMPSKISSEGSVTDSVTLCKNLGIELFTVPIGDAVESFMNVFNGSLVDISLNKENIDKNKITEQNTQSRHRGMILMGFSNRFGYLVLNTGNKSELSTGYFTIGGDSLGGICPVGDLYKTEIFELCRYYNKLHGKELIPNVIIDKEPSAELAPGQVDSNDLPVYPVLDAILKLHIERDVLLPHEIHECKQLLREKSNEEEIKKVIRKVTFNEFKRKLVPPVIHVHRLAYGMAWRMPVAQKYLPINNIQKHYLT